MKKAKENQSKIMLKKQKGITLIALVITIVVLIILATITINFAFALFTGFSFDSAAL